MYAIVLIILLIAVFYGPHLWARHVLSKYSIEQAYFPGTGADLARHLLEKMDMTHVKVQLTEAGDHYNPEEKSVGLHQKHHNGKSLTAIVVATHEVGHAMQHNSGYGPFQMRTKMVRAAYFVEKIGVGLMMAMPVVTLVTRTPAIGFLTFLGGLASLLAPVVVHLLTLGVEWDASFRRAMPILEANLPRKDLPAAKRILTACALTYLAASLSSLLNIYRWIRILRR